MPNGHISDGEVQNEIAQNKMFLGGADKKGCPILLVFGGRHFRNTNPDEFKRKYLAIVRSLDTRVQKKKKKGLICSHQSCPFYRSCRLLS